MANQVNIEVVSADVVSREFVLEAALKSILGVQYGTDARRGPADEAVAQMKRIASDALAFGL